MGELLPDFVTILNYQLKIRIVYDQENQALLPPVDGSRRALDLIQKREVDEALIDKTRWRKLGAGPVPIGFRAPVIDHRLEANAVRAS